MSSHTHPDIPPFPSASTFSILPDIYLLIARLNILHPSSSTTTTTTTSQQQQSQSQTQSQSQSQTQQPLPPPPPPPPQPSQSQISSTSTAAHQAGPPLDSKDLPSQIYPLKQRLARARLAVSALPDVQRSVEEQGMEIRDLEAQVRGLKARIGALAGIAAGAAPTEKEKMAYQKEDKEDGEMDVVMAEQAKEEDVVMESAED